ncbi:restriction system-associated AAA family ATPase [Flavobacterium salilacus subsp. salilacus]|uniref:restriction system-associated AAA family ATPase n=1 Tax=Flavobacterium TaxID=237 RepID=UPI00107514B2|nr:MULTISPECIES: restriction system-associated AAA family ATPase [Flavobacterium]KAF2518829.1 restriction system-associated AAA family ATPase [Flavobacterium salilacus subsp. salilacus]MBE1615012.1 restriction system-associated AAA family ATPase [Flavobacterium sp. SaA2.13]
MKLLKLHIQDEFRSLHSDFIVDFHNLESRVADLETFQPFCFAGLNGSGKSNVLEALASIFYHLEFCVAKFRPQSFDKYFKRHICTPNSFQLEYLIGKHDDKPYILPNFYRVVISKTNDKQKKEVDNEPKMFIQEYPFQAKNELKEISLVPSKNNNEAAEGKIYLPDLVVGYSSGENEILSLPFIKNRLVNFDKYREDYKGRILFNEPETSLIYIDESMSQAVLLAALIFEDDETLKPLKKELGIVGLQSFTMNLNNQGLAMVDKEVITSKPILEHIRARLEDLKKCATSYYEEQSDMIDGFFGPFSVLSLDFFVDDITKKVFKKHFKTSFELFRFFQVLYELNSNIVSDSIKEDVYNSKGFYTDGKLPIPAPQDTVFHFLDYRILKKVKGYEEPLPLLLREFSDGEHQFLHTIGICLMMKERRSLLLLDEPETHFNPSWRAKFIKILNDSITAGNPKGLTDGDINVHLLKDVIITSHSPFIISDCMPNNVIFFKRNEETQKVDAKSALELDFNTYGTSVEIILNELFEYNQSIGDWSKQELLNIVFDKIRTQNDVLNAKNNLRKLGPSIEKDLVLAKLNRIKPENNA